MKSEEKKLERGKRKRNERKNPEKNFKNLLTKSPDCAKIIKHPKKRAANKD